MITGNIIFDTNRSRKFLSHFDNTFLIKEIREPTRKNAILDLLLVYREVLMGEVGTDSHIGYSDYEVREF